MAIRLFVSSMKGKAMATLIQEVSLTESEEKVLKAYMKDDFVSDHGWDSPDAGAWSQDFHKDVGMNGTSFSGVMSSLCKKDIFWSNGESFGLTTKGIEVAKAYEALAL